MPVPYLDMTITAAAAHAPPFYFCQGKTSKGAKKNGCGFTVATRARSEQEIHQCICRGPSGAAVVGGRDNILVATLDPQ